MLHPIYSGDSTLYKSPVNNKYYLSLSGNANNDNVIFKYEVTWSYDEYEFSE